MPHSLPLGRILGLIAATKLLIGLWGVLTVLLGGRELPLPYGILSIWNRWDTPHYLDLARHGYHAPGSGPDEVGLFIVFFPLYPTLIELLTLALRDELISAFVISTIASFAIGPLLYRLLEPDHGPSMAMRAVWFAFVFPTSYFLHIGYTESLFLALVLGAFLAARSDRWLLAGALGGFAALTRVNGIVLLPALAVEIWLRWRRTGELRVEWLSLALIPAGLGAYLVLNWVVAGDPVAFMEVQRSHWSKEFAPPWEGIAGVVRSIFWRSPEEAFMVGWMELAFIALGFAATAATFVRFPASWGVWMAGNWLLFVSTAFVLSVPRYSLAMFPLFAWLALLGRRLWLAALLSVASVGLLGYFAGRFVRGEWAF